jgi:uncharacterized protein
MKRFQLLALSLALCAGLAHAETSPAKKELLAKLTQLQQPGVEQLAMNLLQQPLAQLVQGAQGVLRQMPADKREATGKAMDADLKKFLDENAPLVKDRAAKLAPATLGAIMDERFTEDELRQIVTWLESPVSKKFGQVNGELQKALSDKLLADVGPTLDTRYKALQAALAKHLGLPAPTATPAPAPAAKPAPAPTAPKK